MIGDWPTGRRGALYSRAFYPGPAPPRANTAGYPVWKKIAVSGHDMVDEERLGVEKKTHRPPGWGDVGSGESTAAVGGGGKKK